MNNTYIQYRSAALGVMLALLCALTVAVLPAYGQTDSAATTSTPASAATSGTPAIVGEVTEQEFEALLEDSELETDTSLKRYAIAGTVIALGPGRSGRPVVLLENKSGSTTLLSMATKAIVIREDGTTAPLNSLTPGTYAVITTDTATVRNATVTRIEGDTLYVTGADGTDVAIGTTSEPLFVRGGEEVNVTAYTGGDAVALVEGATSTTVKVAPVLAVIAPMPPEAAPPVTEPVATTAPTTTPDSSQNSMFLWIVLGIAVIILLLGYFLARRGRSTPTDY